MSETAVTTAQPMRYLDKAMGALRDLGLPTPTVSAEESPITGLLSKIMVVDQDRITLIARVLNQASNFNEVVREQIKAMEVGERYETITTSFNSIRDDARGMVAQMEDGRISTMERLSNVWQKATRGDIAARFDKIRDTYIQVSKDTKENIDREHAILEAYRDFRGAMKQAEVMALEVLKTAEGRLEAAKDATDAAVKAAEGATGLEPAERGRLELARDEALRALQAEEGKYQIAKDLADNLTVSYNTSEVIMARLVQTTTAKERVYQQSVSFFSTNEAVLTALTASFTGMHGLHESTRDAGGHEGGREPVAGSAGRDRRQGAGGRAEGGLRPDHPGRCGEEAGGERGELPGALARHHRGDAHRRHPEQRGDPPLGRGSQAAHGAPRAACLGGRHHECLKWWPVRPR